MSDTTGHYFIFVNHDDWDAPEMHEAATIKEVSGILGQIIRDHAADVSLDGLTVRVIHGVEIKAVVKSKDIAVVQIGDEKFLEGMDDES